MSPKNPREFPSGLSHSIAIALLIIFSPAQALSQDAHFADGQGSASTLTEQPAEMGLPVRIISEPAVSAQEITDQRAEIQRSAEDLLAQQQMAKATISIDRATRDMRNYAFWSLVISFLSALIGVIGSTLIFVTFQETRKANGIARKSQEAATRSADIAQSVGVAQVRAYLGIDELSLEWSNDERKVMCARITLKNYGASPARKVQMYSSFHIGIESPNVTRIDGIENASTAPDVNPGQDVTVDKNLPEIENRTALYDWHKVSTGTQFRVFGRIVYEDIFGNARALYFGGELPRNQQPRIGPLNINASLNFNVDLPKSP